ncbi:hypothetical protein [Krasilnikovia sp. M28-CT-15]|uniref:hypothetical protein n=1 Tax=Krasilnikovia sp. M28-CT-15 TaxID=3373540 RepID=UPI003876BCC9
MKHVGHGVPTYAPAGYQYPGQPAPGHGYLHHGHYATHGQVAHHGHGSGMGGVLLGAAGGLAAGYVASEAIDEVFDGDIED